MTIATIKKKSLGTRETSAAKRDAARAGERPLRTAAIDSARAFRNLRMMRLLSRIGRALNEADVEVLLLKGAALNLTLYERPDERVMDDLDLLVRPEDIDTACAALEGLGGLRGKSQVREEFFPTFHYEIEYTLGRIYPVKVDLHVRPFRPLRYSQTVPADAFWADAEVIAVGAASMLHPAPDDMLIHLATHCAIHGNGRESWLTDMARWIERYGDEIDWGRFVEKASSWRLVYAIHFALEAVERKLGVAIPAAASAALDESRVTWRDRLTVLQSPHDATRPTRHVLVNAICTPNLAFVVSYLWGMAMPDRTHMADWYSRRHPGWLLTAHALRILGPLLGKLPTVLGLAGAVEVRASGIHGVGVFARREIKAGSVVGRFHGKRVERGGMYVVKQPTGGEEVVRVELTGPYKFLNHACNPNAKFEGSILVAVRPIRADDEITMDYGHRDCTCGREKARFPSVEMETNG